ncbi:hypothetical protein HMPREF3220_04183 [Citrobacter koseri]|nr:hypothetical protein HMPREF3220_04183 [Citrobacter koseri]KXA02499.1 hypothetical protein HMPREF3207_02361 [Citrobacter koseri]
MDTIGLFEGKLFTDGFYSFVIGGRYDDLAFNHKDVRSHRYED